MKKINLFLLVFIYSVFTVLSNDSRTILEIVESIGDKLIRTTPFKNRLVVAPVRKTFDHLEFIDFGRTLGSGQNGYAYALTSLSSDEDCAFGIQLDHANECTLWLNGKEVYSKAKPNDLRLMHEERSIELQETLILELKKGANILLVQSSAKGGKWLFYIQPTPDKGAVISDKRPVVTIGIENLPLIDKRISEITNWLVCGIFGRPVTDPHELLLFQWGRIYEGASGPVSWTLPKIEILGDVIDPAPWGTNYNWNYHNGGVAWAMQVLSEVTGKNKYNIYASDFCNFHLNNIPFVKYQIEELNAFKCANHQIYKTPLLDFTLAPSIPFIYRLTKEASFPARQEYEKFIERMIRYGENEQIRLPGSNIYTRLTPEVYTTWVDDMYMGIPFLVQAYLYTGKEKYIQDAARQIAGFNGQVWDSEAKLYMHAGYSERNAKLPHWTRANGWGLWAVTEVLLHLPKSDPQYKKILAHYREHINSLVNFQNENGFWYNVLEYPQSREEVSGTAIITMAVARGVRCGWLEKKKYVPIMNKGWDALATQIDMDGTVYNICYGTMCSEDVNYYFNRPFYTDDTHGLFAVLFAGIEIYKCLEFLNK